MALLLQEFRRAGLLGQHLPHAGGAILTAVAASVAAAAAAAAAAASGVGAVPGSSVGVGVVLRAAAIAGPTGPAALLARHRSAGVRGPKLAGVEEV